MNERVRPTKTGLFMTELLICVGVFSLCAAICVGLFVKAEVMSQNSASLNQAVIAARNAAECYKAAGGDLNRAAELAGGRYGGGMLEVYYDQDWQLSNGSGEGVTEVFLLELEPRQAGDTAEAELRVYGPLTPARAYTEAEMNDLELLSWNIAALEVRP